MDLKNGWLRAIFAVFVGLTLLSLNTIFQESFALANLQSIQTQWNQNPTKRGLHAASGDEDLPLMMMNGPPDGFELSLEHRQQLESLRGEKVGGVPAAAAAGPMQSLSVPPNSEVPVSPELSAQIRAERSMPTTAPVGDLLESLVPPSAGTSSNSPAPLETDTLAATTHPASSTSSTILATTATPTTADPHQLALILPEEYVVSPKQPVMLPPRSDASTPLETTSPKNSDTVIDSSPITPSPVVAIVPTPPPVAPRIPSAASQTFRVFDQPVATQKKCEKLNNSHLEKRYVPPNVCLSRADIQQIIINLVHVAADSFAQNNITYWLDSGTLLGSYREHTVIPHDVDADFGMDEASYRNLQTSTVIHFPAPYMLSVLGSSLYDGQGRDDNIPIRVIDTSNGFYIDVFVFLESVDSNGQAMVGPLLSVCFWGCVRCPGFGASKHFVIAKQWVFPLQTCEFAGKSVQCPQEPAKYLDFLYGSNYMIPDRSLRVRR